MQTRDDDYPLDPDISLTTTHAPGGELSLAETPPGSPRHWSWLWQIDYRAHRGPRQPRIDIHAGGRHLVTHYLENGEQGRRWLNLTGIDDWHGLVVHPLHCSLASQGTLHGFSRAKLDDGPVLFVAPHPDDAELAGYGLYRRNAERTWIVTLSAGETLKRLDKQYWPALDTAPAAARRRKGWIRAWNSATTPLLAGIPPERLVMLGYFNDTLAALTADVTSDAASPESSLRPSDFRCWNRMALPTDAGATNDGAGLVADLAFLVDAIRPATVVVTHPEVDPHRDHIAAARASALALRRAGHTPRRVLLYANHLRGHRGFPPGPAHAGASIWPGHYPQSAFGGWRFYSEVLDAEVQREKAVSLDTMHDLRTRTSPEKRFKRLIAETVRGTRGKRYGDHDYFRSHVRCQEPFIEVSGTAFVNALTSGEDAGPAD
ncbi:PIG-L deacetylase family protein [Modicisalibacter coralii]|uniref:PIG-L deacetylase family protein n=1 Tax=Modicisalibacter coralii TaxID=2304602 RepID=UPI00100C1A54|nr:PIG-L family deacetylase [Halomonas coralii]